MQKHQIQRMDMNLRAKKAYNYFLNFNTMAWNERTLY